MENKIILHKELEDAEYKCRTALRKAQEAIRELFKLSDYPTPASLAEVTASSLVAFIKQRVNAVNNTPIYTQAQKDKAIDDWIEWRVKAMPHVIAVENFLSDWGKVNPVLDTATMTIYTNDIAESLKPRFTVDVPLQAHRHIELINGVRNAINELRDWECEQDCKKVDLKKLLSLKEEDIMRSWASGEIKVSHDFDDDARLCAWRKAHDEAIL